MAENDVLTAVQVHQLSNQPNQVFLGEERR